MTLNKKNKMRRKNDALFKPFFIWIFNYCTIIFQLILKYFWLMNASLKYCSFSLVRNEINHQSLPPQKILNFFDFFDCFTSIIILIYLGTYQPRVWNFSISLLFNKKSFTTTNHLFQKLRKVTNKITIIIQILMKQSTWSILLLILVAAVSFFAWDNTKQIQPPTVKRFLQYQTTATRTSNVNKYCAGISRSSLGTTSEVSTANASIASVNSSLGIDGSTLIYQLTNGQMGSALTSIQNGVVNLGIFVGSVVLGLIIFLFIWPFLCCCCCCPSCCPSKCCQKAEDQRYTKCEMNWPAVILTLALLLTMSSSIYGFVNASSISSTFSNLACATSIFTDDLLNGNVTTSGTSFFAGLNTLSAQLTSLGSNLNNLQTYLADLADTGGGPTKTCIDNIENVQTTDIKQIPDTSAPFKLVLSYSTPIDASGAPGTLNSAFIDVLGSFDTSGLLFNVYNSITVVTTVMKQIKANALTFSNAVTGNTVSTTSINDMKTTVTNLASDVNSMDSNLGTMLGFLSMPTTYGNMAMQGFYGFLIAFSFFALIGVLLTACCSKPGCRHLMYFSCMFLFIGALIGFFIASLFSIMVPLFTWTCSYIDYILASQTNFNTNFNSFLSNSTLNQIGVCMPFGNGNLISTVGGTAADGLNNLTSVISSIGSFDAATYQDWVITNWTALTTATGHYLSDYILDLDSSSVAILKSVSDPTNSVYKAGCNGVYATDSWVPATSMDSTKSGYVPCRVSSSNTGNIGSCDDTFANVGGNTCGGCMDSTSLTALWLSAASATSNAQARYGVGCKFADQTLANLWTNYYNKKQVKFAAINTRIAVANPFVTLTTTPGTSSIYQNIGNFQTNLTQINTNMAGISTLTDPTYGILAGMNCQVFGQDFVSFRNVICGSFYNNMYIIRLTFAIASYGILFAMCCIVCTGVRHYKQSRKDQQIDVDIHKNSFQDGSNEKFSPKRRR